MNCPTLIINIEPVSFRSAYLLYYFDVHQMMQQEVPNIPQSEINKRISESWKRLSVAEKAYYLEKAKSEKEGIDTVCQIFCLNPYKSVHLNKYEPFVSLKLVNNTGINGWLQRKCEGAGKKFNFEFFY